MRIDGNSPATQAPPNAEALRQQLQVALLKKSLESQKIQAQALQQLAEGKGQALDIRV